MKHTPNIATLCNACTGRSGNNPCAEQRSEGAAWICRTWLFILLARSRGVFPLLFFASALASASSSKRTASTCPLNTAAWRGVNCVCNR